MSYFVKHRFPASSRDQLSVYTVLIRLQSTTKLATLCRHIDHRAGHHRYGSW